MGKKTISIVYMISFFLFYLSPASLSLKRYIEVIEMSREGSQCICKSVFTIKRITKTKKWLKFGLGEEPVNNKQLNCNSMHFLLLLKLIIHGLHWRSRIMFTSSQIHCHVSYSVKYERYNNSLSESYMIFISNNKERQIKLKLQDIKSSIILLTLRVARSSKLS